MFEVNLESPLPDSLPTGCATAIFCSGTCFHARETVEELAIVVDGIRHRPTAFGMPRPDLNPHGPISRSGFWATVPLHVPEGAKTIELQAFVRLRNGAEMLVPLGQIDVVEPVAPPVYADLAAAPGPETIAICMATFEPEIELLRRQVDSLIAQSDSRWICLVSDDCSSRERFERIMEETRRDPRFIVSRSESRIGFYRNFERALEMVPAGPKLVGLSDQDDRWDPEKLTVLRAAIGDAQAIYSDVRLVDAGGRVLRETLWVGRRNNHTNIASLLIANSISGAATLFRREVVELALPFPDAPGVEYHDHWLGLVALASGDIAYVDRPLYDYVQHPGAMVGSVAATPSKSAGAPSGGWRAAYFYGYLTREVHAHTLLVRCASQLTAPKRRALRAFLASASSPVAFAWLTLRPLRALVGYNETLGSEIELARGLLWRWLMGVLARRARWPVLGFPDASLPSSPRFEQKRLRRWRAGI